MSLSESLNQWNKATANLPWGVQRVFHDTFALVSQEKVHLVYGQDYRDGKPCLVNAVGAMLTTGGGEGIPSTHFGEIVSLFDTINRSLEKQGVNDGSGYVSPLAADILLKNFAPLQEKPVEAEVDEATASAAFEKGVYVEPKDEDFARDLMNAMQAPAPEDITDRSKQDDPIVQYTKQHVDYNLVKVKQKPKAE